MYLSKLDVIGFKTFAQKTQLRFTEGLTGIVGPNGSGKTNIVDALRWVLGEQKSSVLRSDGMEQVIFNGTRHRKPLGMAEVSLTIENNKHILPTEYSQVVITRRLFRDGGSEYLLNKTPCRLRDIVDLFTDTGMGADAYSVIELKMIETILSDKTDDRRHLFEEAAGVVKYKQRRKETLRRLASTQTDIERLQDIVREVQKAVGSLGRQADKAKQYSEVSEVLKSLEVELFHREYSDALQNLDSIARDIAYHVQDRTTISTELEKAEKQVREIEARDAIVEKELSDAQELERAAQGELNTVQQDFAVAQERYTGLLRTVERTRQEQEDTKRQLENTKVEIGASQKRLEDLLEQRETDSAALALAREQREISFAAAQQLREKSRSASEPVLALDNRIHFLVSGRDRIRKQADILRERSSQSAKQADATERLLADVAKEIQAQGANVQTAAQEILLKEETLQKARVREQELTATIEHSQHEISERRNSLSHKKASLEFLEGLSTANETASFLLNNNQWEVQKTVLSELISTDDVFAAAIESALGEAGGYIVVQTKNDALSARGILREANKGKASFVCRETIPHFPAPQAAPALAGVRGWASELVSTDDDLRSALRGILGSTLVVDTLDNGFEVIAQAKADCAVTLDGELVTKSGVVRGGATSTTEGMRVGKQKKISTLQSEIQTLAAEVATLDQLLQQARTERGTINVHLLSDEVRKAEQRKNSVDTALHQLHFKQQNLLQQLEQHRSSIQTHSSENAEIVKEDEHIQKELDELRAKKEEAQAQLNVMLDELRSAEQELLAKENSLRSAEITAVKTNAEAESLDATMRRLIELQATMEERLEQQSKELEVNRGSISEIEQDLSSKKTQLATVEESFQKVRSVRIAAEAKAQTARDEMHKAAEVVRSNRVKLDALVATIHDLEIKESSLKTRAEDFKIRAENELNVDLNQPVHYSDELLTLEETRTKVQTLKQRLQGMGNVNFMALEEHGKEQERLTLLKTQLQDLLDAEKNLTDTINEINTTAQRQFIDTFEKVRTHFKELFTMLFMGDGEAELRMEGDDPLECHIEIIAKPKGKRPHSIEMLSGGEKTLTAIALLFAIYLVKPSPFCILDEVDAPLDDANIDRYLALIRKFSENTQFLMITHNKKTMEAADTLYGVTMEEQGVSKLVSVKFDESARQSEEESSTEEETV